MTSYVVDKKLATRENPHNCHDIIYHFQIDINGNVYIKKGNNQCITINDNIPIPTYLIKTIELLIKGITLNDEQIYNRELLNPLQGIPKLRTPPPINRSLYITHFELVADTIIRIKTSLKEITENPKEYLDLEQQLNSYIAKSKLQQEHILEVEKKMKNIQTKYIDTLNDNKKTKEMNIYLRTRIAELEIKLNKEISKTNNKKQLDEYYKLEQKILEDLEKERVWYEYKQRKNNFNPLNH
jgi:hypothetical protein